MRLGKTGVLHGITAARLTTASDVAAAVWQAVADTGPERFK